MNDAGAWLVYLLRCADGTYYCGVTCDLERRLEQHNQGKGAKYTRGRRPVTLAAVSAPLQKSHALSVEAKVKRLPRDQKPPAVRNCREIEGEKLI